MAVANAQKLMGTSKTTQSAAQPEQQLIAAPADIATLQGISRSLTQIIQLLNQQNSQVTAEATQERKSQENARRKKIELGLENSFAAVKNVAQAVVAPVKNILDSIIQFFLTLFLGKAILNLIDWFSKEENQGKVKSIARFLKDWWPSLVAAYILFGTGFGRVVRNLAGIAIRAIGALGGIILKLGAAIATATGFKKAGAAMSALGGGGGWKGSLARMGVGLLATAGTAVVANKMMGGGDAPQVAVPEPAPIPTPEMFGGGLIDFKTMLAASGGQVDSKLGIFAQLFGSGGFAGLMNSVPGFVSGPKGIDKVPAMLTDGEFVMSRGAVQKFGVSNLEAMNAAGGGTNKPKIVQKRIYATTGGFIGDEKNKKMMNKGDIDDKELRTVYDTRHGPGTYDKEKPPVEDKNDTKLNLQPTYGPGAMPSMSTQADMNALSNKIRFNERITKIKNEMQSKKALASGKGINIKGAGLGSDIGTGYGTKYKGKNAVKVKLPPGGSYETEITLAGQRYFAIKKGDDIIYVEQDKRDVGGGGMFGGPRESARSNYAESKGGAIKGGFGLKDQSFKDAPKTQIMTDDKGKPFVGHKSMKDGKLHYSRGPQPGTGTSNPFEAFGRAINPGAYKENDKKLAMQNQRVAATNSLESLQVRGASADTQSRMMKQIGANSNQTQNDLSYRKSKPTQLVGTRRQQEIAQYKAAGMANYSAANISTVQRSRAAPPTPTPRPAPKIVSAPPVAGGGMGGKRGSGAKATIPQFNASKNNSKTAKQLNIK